MAYGLGCLKPRSQQSLQVFKMTALGFESGFQGSKVSFKLMECVELIKNLLIFSIFFYWNVPWHAAVTTLRCIPQLGLWLSKNANEIIYIKNIARTTSELMALEWCQVAILHPSTNCVRGYSKQPTGFRDRNSATGCSGGFCHQLESREEYRGTALDARLCD